MSATFKVDEQKIINTIAAKLHLRPSKIKVALDLMKEGGTVHFIARYRKEMTDNMDEEVLRVIKDDYESLDKLENRKKTVLQSIKSNEKFQALDETKQSIYEKRIINSKTFTELDDLYAPYKSKRKTLATKALEKGLGPLAEIIKSEPTEGNRDEIIAPFITAKVEEEKLKKEKEKSKDELDDLLIKKPLTGKKLLEAQKKEEEEKKAKAKRDKNLVKDEKEALDGATDIIAEEVGQNPDYIKYIRELYFEKSIIVSSIKKEIKEKLDEQQKDLEALNEETMIPEELEIEEEKQEEEEEEEEIKISEKEIEDFYNNLDEMKKKGFNEALDFKLQQVYEKEEDKKVFYRGEKSKTYINWVKKNKDRVKREKIIEEIQYIKSKSKDKKRSKKDIKKEIERQKREKKRIELARRRKKEQELLKKQQRELKGLEVGGGGEELGKKEVDPTVYEMYFDFKQKAFGDDGIPPHRILAISRGEGKDKVLSVSWEHPTTYDLYIIEDKKSEEEYINQYNDFKEARSRISTMLPAYIQNEDLLQKVLDEMNEYEDICIKVKDDDYKRTRLMPKKYKKTFSINIGDVWIWLEEHLEAVEYLKENLITKQESLFLEEYEDAIESGYKRYIKGKIERELWSELKTRAEEHAISVFAKNIKAYLMQPPLKDRAIISLDPGYAHGTKLAVIDEKGQFKEEAIILKFQRKQIPPNEIRNAVNLLTRYMRDYNAFTFAIGNGTASREIESFVAQHMTSISNKVEYVIVNEAGASVYSASKMAQEEFPDLGVEARGAISIGRRIQDPLSELIKIDPKSIGVGMYQHDVNQNELKKQLDETIEDCVNTVGVLVNTASYKLLEYVSGLNSRLARAIYDYRIEHGGFKNREELQQVPGIGDKTYEQCAGFIKINDGTNPLDRTIIHPESYWIVEKLLEFIELTPDILADPSRRKELTTKIKSIKPKLFVDFLGKDIGMPTLKQIVLSLLKPGRDPRDDLPPPILRKDILKMEDLKPNEVLKGTVRNVVDFGAFVDIGLHDDGLVHISEMRRLDGKTGFISDPTEILGPGDIIDVRVLKVDMKKHRIQLSMYLDPDASPQKKSSGKKSSRRDSGDWKSQAMASGISFRKK